jgi:hypothetical protein
MSSTEQPEEQFITPEEEPFSSDAQNAIFNFLFVLVAQYSESMPSIDAINKACDWLISLGESIKKQANEFDSDLQQKYNLFTN